MSSHDNADPLRYYLGLNYLLGYVLLEAAAVSTGLQKQWVPGKYLFPWGQ